LHPIFLQEAEEKQEDETASSNTSKSGKKQNARPVDLDPHGEKLVQVFIFATGLI
jgi:peptide alpha-N-acetyltransferase